MDKYTIKWAQEIVWAAIVAAAGAVAVTLAGIPLEDLLNRPAVVIGLIAAAVARAVGAVIWNAIANVQASSDG